MSSKQNVSTQGHADPHVLLSSLASSLDVERILGGLSPSFTWQVILGAVDTSQVFWDHVAFVDPSIAALPVNSGDIQPGLSPSGGANLTWN